jgi:ABC-type glutathione transport system ATPase component
MLDEDQQTAFELAKDGHNLVVIGQGGCGKTFLIKQIVNYLRSKGKNVTIACSTGIASTHYGKLEGTTLHMWSGILNTLPLVQAFESVLISFDSDV